MTTTPDPPPPSRALDAAVAALVGAVPSTRLVADELMTGGPGDHPRPRECPVVVAMTLRGVVEGTITIAIEDELADRLEYEAKAAGPAQALAPAGEAVAAVFAELGEVEATPLADVEADAWPGGADVITSVLLRQAADRTGEGEAAVGLAVAFALPMPPAGAAAAAAAAAGNDAVSAPGLSSMSTSAGPAATYVPGGGPARRALLSPEARRLAAIELELAGVLGESTVVLHELLGWLPGVIVPLHRDVGMPVDVRIDDTTVAHAEIVVMDERYALRILDVVAGATERVAKQRAAGDSAP